jgi:ABC-type glycerol-3-phosphate transport system substrate-binding protein
MSMKRLMILTALALACATSLSATGTVTVTRTTDTGVAEQRVTVAWTSHSDGTVTGNAFAAPGRLYQVEIVPGTSGTQPTDLYDLTITTAAGLDILTTGGVSQGANLSNTTPLMLVFDPPLIIDSSLTLDVRVSNAGNAKAGSVIFWMSR